MNLLMLKLLFVFVGNISIFLLFFDKKSKLKVAILSNWENGGEMKYIDYQIEILHYKIDYFIFPIENITYNLSNVNYTLKNGTIKQKLDYIIKSDINIIH